MGDRDHQLVTYVTAAEKKQLQEWAEKTGKSQSALLREAVLEYTDHDRTRRIEEKVDQILDRMDAHDGDTHTHKGGNTKSVPEKARAVADHLYSHYDAPINESDVELAIENIADVGDDRSVRKYKSQLKKRNLLFEHPAQPVWTDDKQEWVEWMELAHVESVDVSEATAGYGISNEEYADLAEELEQ
jgi:hypothetical protein